ncbi:MAG: hypothetical protein CFH30_00550 [Alphaproteobacteria bacterium MarineAlpha8_Bin1]|mgnify:FL=1|nr:MAG: hypothetical protein CFH30_00550 [Alphaproteobacteria bacterium MarineAlpha8_Bin1]
METYLIFDLTILIFILLSALFAFLRGFSQEFLSLLSWTGSFFGSYFFASYFINNINKFFGNLILSSVVAYILVFIVLLFFLSFLTKRFSQTIKSSDVGMVDRTLGFLFGILRGYFIISLGLFSFNFFYDGSKIKWINDSKINFVVLLTNSKVLDFLSENSEYSKKIKKEIEKKSNQLFEKSVDSHLKLRNHSEKEEKLYNEKDRGNLDYLIENSNQ